MEAINKRAMIYKSYDKSQLALGSTRNKFFLYIIKKETDRAKRIEQASLEAFFAFVNCMINKKKTEYKKIRNATVSFFKA